MKDSSFLIILCSLVMGVWRWSKSGFYEIIPLCYKKESSIGFRFIFEMDRKVTLNVDFEDEIQGGYFKCFPLTSSYESFHLEVTEKSLEYARQKLRGESNESKIVDSLAGDPDIREVINNLIVDKHERIEVLKGGVTIKLASAETALLMDYL